MAPMRRNLFPFRVGSFSTWNKNNIDRVVLLKSVLFALKSNKIELAQNNAELQQAFLN